MDDLDDVILVVDDDDRVLHFVRRALVTAGFRNVQLASGAREALAFVRQHRVSVVVTDLRMPDVSGLDLLNQVRGLSPATKLLAMTAYPDCPSVRGATEAGAARVLYKPFDAALIRGAVHEALCGPLDRRRNAAQHESLLTRARILTCFEGSGPLLPIRAHSALSLFTNRRAIASAAQLTDEHGPVDLLITSDRAFDPVLVNWGCSATHAGTGVIVIDERQTLYDDFKVSGLAIVDNAALEGHLAGTVFREIATAVRRRLAHEIAGQRLIAPHVARLLEVTCERDKPPLTVAEGVAFLRYDRSRTTKEWRQTSFADVCASLKDAHDWLLLWRVALEKRPENRWVEAAAMIGLAYDRLNAICQRLAGRNVTDILRADDWRADCPFRTVQEFSTCPPK